MNEQQLKAISVATKNFNRGLLSLDDVRLKLECENVPSEEIEKVIAQLSE